jgi:hypothetical protein
MMKVGLYNGSVMGQLIGRQQRSLPRFIGVYYRDKLLEHLFGLIQLVPSDPPAEQKPGISLNGCPNPCFAVLSFEVLVALDRLFLYEGPQLVKLDLFQIERVNGFSEKHLAVFPCLENVSIDRGWRGIQ